MKISINFTLDVDPEAWAVDYGIEGGAPAVRADVKTYVQNTVHDHLQGLGMLTETAS